VRRGWPAALAVHMEARLRRFSWLIALSALFLFGPMWAWNFHHVQKLQSDIDSFHESLNQARVKCSSGTGSDCDRALLYEAHETNVIRERDSYAVDAKRYLVLLLLVPSLTAFIFLAGRWVMTGRGPTWPQV
jgi:hypothetical protein